jgi:hypothetical protein
LRESDMNVIINAVRRSVGFLVAAFVTLSVGCGVDGDLTCGFSTCKDAASPGEGAVGIGADAIAAVDSAEGAAEASDGPATASGEGGADSSTSDAGGDALAPNDAMSGGDGCSMCGLNANCCAPDYQCVGMGTTCCGNEGATCGGDKGQCCAVGATQLACTAARQCAKTCAMLGSCTGQPDCCLGSYCDSTNSCVACLALNAACSQAYQCCSGACRNSVCASE